MNIKERNILIKMINTKKKIKIDKKKDRRIH